MNKIKTILVDSLNGNKIDKMPFNSQVSEIIDKLHKCKLQKK